jgi:RNA polymerase sigma-70 factor (ECF subfamily)
MGIDTREVKRLAREYSAGDCSAFEKLYSLLYDNQFYFALKMLRDNYTAEEATQETFLKAFEKFSSLETPDAFLKWLYKINYNTCINIIQNIRQNTETLAIDDYIDKIEDENNRRNPQISAERHEQWEIIKETLEASTEEVKATVILRYFNELKENEVAEILSIPCGTVKSRLNHFRAELSQKSMGVYSLFPILLLRIYFLKDSSGMGLAGGFLSKSISGNYIFRASAIGVAAGLTGAVLLSGPVIKSISIYDPTRMVNRQCVRVFSEGIAGLDSISLNGREMTSDKRGAYTAMLNENGLYTIMARTKNGGTDVRMVRIQNIDNTSPDCTGIENEKEAVSVYFTDDLSGIFWEGVEAENSVTSFPVRLETVRETGKITIQCKDLPASVRITDCAGNYSDYLIEEEQQAGVQKHE